MTKQNAIQFLKKHWSDLLGFTYFVASLTTIGFLGYKMYQEKQIVEVEPIVITEDKTDKRIEVLQQDIKNLTIIVKQLEVKNEELAKSNTVLEKRQQTQTEFAKRVCEYIVVITVDKKILPRQCLADYNWTKE